MPANKLNKHTAAIIAAEYCGNGYNEVESLIKIGYSRKYSINNHKRLFKDVLIKDAIDRIQAENKAISNYTREQHLQALLSLEQALSPQIAQGNVTAIRTACTIRAEIGNSTGLHSQTINSDDKQVAKPLSAAEREELNRLANIKLKQCAG